MARRYHLGLDWGTSATKMVLRDYSDRSRQDTGSAIVIEYGTAGSRYPSTIAFDGERFWFGFEAEKRRSSSTIWDSLKAKAAVQNGWLERVPGLHDWVFEDLVMR